MRHSTTAILLLATFLGCGSESPTAEIDAGSSDAGDTPSCTQVTDDLHSALDAVSTDADFSLLLQDSEGRSFSHSIGSATPNTVYESASTAKWVTATTILRLVDEGVLSLDDNPQDYLDFWTSDPTNSLANMTLSHLLSFTSGLEKGALCTNLGGSDFATCVERIYNANLASPVTPGSGFYYHNSHLQVAGLMAINAASKANWGEVFADFQSGTGAFPTGIYDLPSEGNPRLAGGMHWRGDEYLEFLSGFYHDQFLSVSLKATVLADHRATASSVSSPAIDGIDEDWHYGYGFWIECKANPYNCSEITRISSPGLYGAYPFIDYRLQYYGILARQGGSTTFTKGKELLDTVNTEIEAWAACRP